MGLGAQRRHGTRQGKRTNRLTAALQSWSVLLQVFLMPQKFSADIERFRAQLRHFCFFYGLSARRLGVHLAHDPTRAYSYLKGTKLPTWRTRREWRAFMRRYRKSVMI